MWIHMSCNVTFKMFKSQFRPRNVPKMCCFWYIRFFWFIQNSIWSKFNNIAYVWVMSMQHFCMTMILYVFGTPVSVALCTNRHFSLYLAYYISMRICVNTSPVYFDCLLRERNTTFKSLCICSYGSTSVWLATLSYSYVLMIWLGCVQTKMLNSYIIFFHTLFFTIILKLTWTSSYVISTKF